MSNKKITLIVCVFICFLSLVRLSASEESGNEYIKLLYKLEEMGINENLGELKTPTGEIIMCSREGGLRGFIYRALCFPKEYRARYSI